jgi:hypothetical protein
MKKLTLALAGLALGSVIAGASAAPNVYVYNATNCAVDFYALSKGFFSQTIGSALDVAAQTLTPTTLAITFPSTGPTDWVVKATPTGFFSWYYADNNCYNSPTIAYLSCTKDNRGKCTTIELSCSYICPTCTPPGLKK